MQEFEHAAISGLTSLTDISIIRERYRDYTKVMSIANLIQLGLPVLPGFVIEEMNEQVLEFAYAWARNEGSSIRSIRFDSTNPEDIKKLGFANLALEDLKKVTPLIQPPVIGILLAENIRYMQGHSVTISFYNDTVIIDAVGPGFDAADVTRGQVISHERIVLQQPRYNEGWSGELTPATVLAHSIISQDQYSQTREERYAKILSIIEQIPGIAAHPHILTKDEAMLVHSFLISHGNDVPFAYEPLGYDRIHELYKLAIDLSLIYSQYYGEGIEGKTLAGSYLHKHGFVCWDIYSQHKYGRVKKRENEPDRYCHQR